MNYINVVRETSKDTDNVSKLLKTKARKVGIQIDVVKTKLTEFIDSGEDPEESEGPIF